MMGCPGRCGKGKHEKSVPHLCPAVPESVSISGTLNFPRTSRHSVCKRKGWPPCA